MTWIPRIAALVAVTVSTLTGAAALVIVQEVQEENTVLRQRLARQSATMMEGLDVIDGALKSQQRHYRSLEAIVQNEKGLLSIAEGLDSRLRVIENRPLRTTYAVTRR